MVCPPSRGSCLPLSLIVLIPVSLCWMVSPPSRLFCLLCFPLCPFLFPLLDGVSAFLRSCLPLSPSVSLRMVCAPSHARVSSCVPLSPRVCACVRRRVRLPEAFAPLVSQLFSHCLPTCVPVLDGVSAFPRSCLPLSPIVLPHVLDFVSAFPRPCLPLSPLVAPSPIVSHCLPLSHGCPCWLVCPRSCLPLFRPVSHCLPLSPHTCAFVGWCVRGLAFLVSQLFSQLISQLVFFPFLEGVSAFPGCCLRLPSIVSRTCAFLDGVSLCPLSCRVLSPSLSSFLFPFVTFAPLLAFPRPCLACLPAYLLACFQACLPACLLSCLPAYLPACLLPFVGRCVGLPEALSPLSPLSSSLSPILSPPLVSQLVFFWPFVG